MMDVGRICVKIAGRDAGNKCVVVEVLDNNFVIIDGETRRRKCNVKHLEPLAETVKISKGATHQTIVSEFKKMGIDLKETKPRKAKIASKQIRAADRKKMAPKEEKKKDKKEKTKTDTDKKLKTEKTKKEEKAEPKETELEKAVAKEEDK